MDVRVWTQSIISHLLGEGACNNKLVGWKFCTSTSDDNVTGGGLHTIYCFWANKNSCRGSNKPQAPQSPAGVPTPRQPRRSVPVHQHGK